MEYNSRRLGAVKEELAAEYLKNKGYRILEMNYRYRQGEIDLIVFDGSYLVFCEVKYRNNSKAGYPEEAVTFSKQRSISRCASHYMLCHNLHDISCRFDVISILGSQIRHYENAFDYIA